MEKEDIISSGILELYATGISSEQEALSVEQWMSEYPEVYYELLSIFQAIEAYAQFLGIVPASIIKQKIMRRINEGITAKIIPLDAHIQPLKISKTVPVIWRNLAAASMVVLLASVVINFVTFNKYHVIEQDMAAMRLSFETLRQNNVLAEADMEVVHNRYSVPVALKGSEAAPEAAAKVFWMQHTGDVFVDATNLPEVPAGKRYQLWGFVNGAPVDGGMLMLNNNGGKYHIQKMRSFDKVEAFAISLEPEEGNRTPKGPVFVMGKM